jgi:phosphatidylglycerol:prolipoprotein diacylglycerol transferase
VPLAVITLQFDPLVHVGDWTVRWETLGIAAAILVGLLVAGLLAGRARLPARADAPPGAVDHLRRDDALFIALGTVPGAVIGGRIAYVLLHFDYYSANPGAITDPLSGSLALSGAVILGAVTGGLVASLFDAPVGRWYTVAAIPMLLALGLGKAANILGGTGQGLPSTADWATRYLGPGPWGSLGPDIPSIPAQAFEAIGVAVVVGVVLVGLLVARQMGRPRARDGRLFALALGGWAVVRFLVAGTWRDPAVVGPLKAEQLFDLAIIGLAVVIYVSLFVRARRRSRAAGADEPAPPDLSWPDPQTRHPF